MSLISTAFNSALVLGPAASGLIDVVTYSIYTQSYKHDKIMPL